MVRPRRQERASSFARMSATILVSTNAVSGIIYQSRFTGYYRGRRRLRFEPVGARPVRAEAGNISKFGIGNIILMKKLHFGWPHFVKSQAFTLLPSGMLSGRPT